MRRAGCDDHRPCHRNGAFRCRGRRLREAAVRPAAEPEPAAARPVPAGPARIRHRRTSRDPTMPTGSPTQRRTVNHTKQQRTTPGAPSDTTSTGAGAMPNDAPAGSTTTRTRLGPGSETGRVPGTATPMSRRASKVRASLAADSFRAS